MIPGVGGRPHSARRPLGRDRRGPATSARTPQLRAAHGMHGDRAIPVPQNAKTLVPYEFFTHSLAKVRS